MHLNSKFRLIDLQWSFWQSLCWALSSRFVIIVPVPPGLCQYAFKSNTIINCLFFIIQDINTSNWVSRFLQSVTQFAVLCCCSWCFFYLLAGWFWLAIFYYVSKSSWMFAVGNLLYCFTKISADCIMTFLLLLIIGQLIIYWDPLFFKLIIFCIKLKLS